MSEVGPRSDIGPILSYLKDTTKLPPELVRPEHCEFTITIRNQAELARSPNIALSPEYVFVLRRIMASISDPNANAQQATAVTFTVRDQGNSRFDLFQSPIRLSWLTAPGTAQAAVWDGFYVFMPRADLQPIWGVDLTQFLPQQQVFFSVDLFGDLVRIERLANGVLMIPGMTDR